jgi:amino acid transporter
MVLAALWAYDGWNNLPMAAGEVRDPQRNLPRAIIGGMIVVFATYAIVNLGYFFALPFGDVATSSSTPTPMLRRSRRRSRRSSSATPRPRCSRVRWRCRRCRR